MPRLSSSRILVVDPDLDSIGFIVDSFSTENFFIVSCQTGDEAIQIIEEDPGFHAVIAEYRLEGVGGLALVGELKKRLPHVPVVIVTSNPASGTAIEAIKAGAYDFLAKPIESGELIKTIREAVDASRRMSKTVKIGLAPNAAHGEDAMIGKSRAMLEVYKALGRLSPTPVTVLIRGETGTGKELVARALYQHGHRPHKPFVTVNCAAIPENLLESELFGHEKGSFTGAVSSRIGKFEQANNATLFLDEIGDLDLSLQAKLLRVLQERQIQRVGGREEIPIDVRIIAATHRDIEKMVANGSFREDLFYRLNVAAIALPPLRSRDGDIALLVDYFLAGLARELSLSQPSITTRAIHYLEEQPWPGNVRQLQNVIRKALLGARGYAVDVGDLQEILRESEVVALPGSNAGASLRHLATESIRKAQSGEVEGAYAEMIDLAEKVLLSEAIDLTNGNLSKASRWLGISRLTLREKLRKHSLRSD